jgi:hypothetical protein
MPCCAQVIRLIEAVEGLKAQLDVPATIRQVMNKASSSAVDAAYLSTTLEMAYQAFDDQCTGANPRYPVGVRACEAFEAGCWLLMWSSEWRCVIAAALTAVDAAGCKVNKARMPPGQGYYVSAFYYLSYALLSALLAAAAFAAGEGLAPDA